MKRLEIWFKVSKIMKVVSYIMIFVGMVLLIGFVSNAELVDLTDRYVREYELIYYVYAFFLVLGGGALSIFSKDIEGWSEAEMKRIIRLSQRGRR